MIQRIVAGTLVAASIVAFGGAVVVAQTPEEQVETRQNQMKTLGRSMKTIGDFLKEGTGTIADVQQAAAAIAEGTGRLPSLFPEGTGVGVSDSDALLVIWERPDDFTQRMEAVHAAAADLLAAAETGDRATVAQAFQPVGQACGGCHEVYRVKD